MHQDSEVGVRGPLVPPEVPVRNHLEGPLVYLAGGRPPSSRACELAEPGRLSSGEN